MWLSTEWAVGVSGVAKATGELLVVEAPPPVSEDDIFSAGGGIGVHNEGFAVGEKVRVKIFPALVVDTHGTPGESGKGGG